MFREKRSKRCAKASWRPERSHEIPGLFILNQDGWPDYDGLGEEESLPPQDADDNGEVGVPELRRELLVRAPQLPFLQSYVGEALRWLDDEESTEVMLASTGLLQSNLGPYSGPWAEIGDDLRAALSNDEGEDMLYALLRLIKELNRA